MYVCYLFEKGRHAERWPINCDGDAAARGAAEDLLAANEAYGVEVWQGSRLVYQLATGRRQGRIWGR